MCFCTPANSSFSYTDQHRSWIVATFHTALLSIAANVCVISTSSDDVPTFARDAGVCVFIFSSIGLPSLTSFVFILEYGVEQNADVLGDDVLRIEREGMARSRIHFGVSFSPEQYLCLVMLVSSIVVFVANTMNAHDASSESFRRLDEMVCISVASSFFLLRAATRYVKHLDIHQDEMNLVGVLTK